MVGFLDFLSYGHGPKGHSPSSPPLFSGISVEVSKPYRLCTQFLFYFFHIINLFIYFFKEQPFFLLDKAETRFK